MFSMKYARCGDSNYHSCQTRKLCSKLLELLQSAPPPLSRVHRPLDGTIQQAVENSRGIPGIPFAIRRRCYFLAFYKLSWVRKTSSDVHRISHSTALWRWEKCFSKSIPIDRSFRREFLRPFASRSTQRRSVGEMTYLPVTYLSRACREFLSFDRTREICIFPENHDRYFHQVDIFPVSRILRDPSLKLVARTLFPFRIMPVAMFSWNLSIYIFQISACSIFFFQSNIFLLHSMYTFHSIFPYGKIEFQK